MMSPQCRPACGRTTFRTGVVAAGLTMLLVAPAWAQDAPAPAQPPPQPAPDAPAQPPAQAPAQPDAPAPAQPPSNPFVLGSQAGLFTYVIKADKTADFERVMGKLHEALANSDKPERRQQAAGWKLYKAAEPGPNGNAVYYNVIAPVLKGADYTPSKIIAEVFPSEAQALFLLYRDAFAALGRNELTLLHDFGEPAPRTPPVATPPATPPASTAPPSTPPASPPATPPQGR